MSTSILPSRRRAGYVALIALFPLLIPAVAKQFTAEVNWDETDFIVMGTLMLLVGFGIDLAWRTIRNRNARIIAIGAALLAFLLIWAELAVGVFGTPFAGS